MRPSTPIPSIGTALAAARRATRLDGLRQVLTRLEGSLPSGAKPEHLALGAPAVHRHLSGPGLACGVLHDVAAAAPADNPAALGFVCALAAIAQQSRPGPAVVISSRGALRDHGQLYGHGLAQLGLDPGRLMLVDAPTCKEALWAIEETARSGARPAVIAGIVDAQDDFTVSRRLNLAAAASGAPLMMLRVRASAGVSAAATRWRIGAAPAAWDRFDTLARVRWRVTLERCRNGCPGQWLIEWNHVAHCFSLVEGVADRAPVAKPGLRRAS